LDSLCQGWTAKYTGHSLSDKSVLFDFVIALPADQISTILRLDSGFTITENFSFPVAFREDMCQFIILRSVIRINPELLSTSSSAPLPGEIYNSQVLTKPCGKNSQSGDYVIANHMFSRNSKFLAVIEGKGRLQGFNAWRVEVWRDCDPHGLLPQFEFAGTFQPSHFENFGHRKFTRLAFHPSLPLVVFPRWSTTSLWWFDGDSEPVERSPSRSKIADFCNVELSSPVDIFHQTLERLHFTSETEVCGYPILTNISIEAMPGYQYAKDTSDSKDGEYAGPVIIQIADIISRYSPRSFHLASNKACNISPNSSIISTTKESIVYQTPHSLESQLFDREVIDYDVNIANEASIQEYGSSQISVHLPQSSMMQNTFLSFIRPSTGQEWLTVVWNMGPQLTYSVLTPQNQHVPSIIEKKRTLSASQNRIGEGRALKRIRQVAEGEPTTEQGESSTAGELPTTEGESPSEQGDSSIIQRESPAAEGASRPE
jgi:hypothetical protein